MPPTPIAHVSDTALWVADYRARETLRSDALFQDPLAGVLAGARGREIAQHLRNENVMAWAIALRTRIIDDFIMEGLASGVDVVLNLGAGLDTRPYRLDTPQELHWIEVDYPHMIQFKKERLAGEKPRCRLERVALDLADLHARNELFAHAQSESRRVLVLTEGVTPYLTNDAVAALADDLRKQSRFVSWVLDYHATNGAIGFGRKRMKRDMRNAPFQFAPDNWPAFFAGHGWNLGELRYYAEEAVRLRRPLKLSWRLWLFTRFITKKRAQMLKRLAGVALLHPQGSVEGATAAPAVTVSP